jgi:chaperone required for assembly of F1-ATPase
MTGERVKRFYKQVSASAASDGGCTVLLDGKPIKTPARATLTLPSQALAEAVAEEWRGQGDAIDMQAMPLTRLAFAAIDTVSADRARIAEQALRFGGSDLVCYRAEAPPDLAAQQAAAWDPLLDWLAEEHRARLSMATGIAFIEQPADALLALEQAVWRHDDFALAGLHAVATITGSLVLALALSGARLSAAEAFALAMLDEDFQAEKWGRDAEAEQRRTRLLSNLTAAERFLRVNTPSPPR